MNTLKIDKSAKIATCYHCGDECKSSVIQADNHEFCCEGCKLVYELLKENNLCNYYDLEEGPGNKANEWAGKFSALDENSIRSKLIRFEDKDISRVVFYTPGMHCSSCIWLLEHLYKLNPSIVASSVNFPRKEVTVDFRTNDIKLSTVAEVLSRTGYPPSISLGDLELKEKKKGISPRVLKIGIAGFCFANIMLLSFPEYLTSGDLAELPHLKAFFGWLSLALALPVLLYSASDFFVSAWKAIRLRTLNIDAPIALAVAVTFGRSLYEIIAHQETSYLDSMTGIVFFMLLGRYFQDRTYERLSFERDYKSYFPISVTILDNNTEKSVPVTDVKQGARIRVHHGEIIPADAILVSDVTYVDYSFVTGESDPVTKRKGEKIFAGARLTNSSAELIVQDQVSQSYLTQLWNNDSFSRRRTEERKTYIDFINRWFSSAVILTSLSGGVAWLFINPAESMNVLTAVLIVACPCTLLLASTFTNASVLHWLGKFRFYLKNADAIDRIATSDVTVFDKTGTITNSGESRIEFDGAPLTLAEKQEIAALTKNSGHPLSRKINAWLDQAEFPEVHHYSEVSGKGISGDVNGKHYIAGSAVHAGSSAKHAHGASEVWIAVNNQVRGHFVIHNRLREGLNNITSELKHNYKLELLSGDNDSQAELLKPIFNDSMRFSCTPQDKLDHIAALQKQGHKVIMIGDGLNDAGALAQAEAGIAISDNTNNFFPACDAILDGRSFHKLPGLLRYAKIARKIVVAAFIVSVCYNFFGMYYSLSGQMSPLIAAILMPLSSFSVILIATISTKIAASTILGKPEHDGDQVIP
jgi:P-type Cu+ transporter